MDHTVGVDPLGVCPGELGAVLSGEVTYEHVAATLLDLAARGHLTITALAPGADDLRWWELGLADGADELRPFEEQLLDETAVYSGPQRFPHLTVAALHRVGDALLGECAGQGWFVRDPARRRRIALWVTAVTALAALAIVIGLAGAGELSVGAVPAVLVVSLGGLVLAGRRRRPVCSPRGADLASAGNAFRTTLLRRPDTLAAEHFAHAAAAGKADAAARALTDRGAPLPRWLRAAPGGTATWETLAVFTTRSLPSGPLTGLADLPTF